MRVEKIEIVGGEVSERKVSRGRLKVWREGAAQGTVTRKREPGEGASDSITNVFIVKELLLCYDWGGIHSVSSSFAFVPLPLLS